MVFYKKTHGQSLEDQQHQTAADDGRWEEPVKCACLHSTYCHKVGVDVIGAHGVGISRMQDDPGVVDLWEEDVSQEFVGEREEAVLITRADRWVPVRISFTNTEML